MVNNPPANAGDTIDPASIPESGRSAGIGDGNPPQYSCLGSPMEEESRGLQDLTTKQQFFIQQYSFIVSISSQDDVFF